MTNFSTWIETHRVRLSGALAWERVIGHHEAKQQLRGVLTSLLDPEALSRVGAALPRGLLLHGEPGTGKTMTARTFAAELDRAAQEQGRPPVPFYEVPASALSAERLAEVARWSAVLTDPAVLYVDEIELWGADRNSPYHDPDTRASLFAALSAIDGLTDTSRLIWVASANKHPGQLDEALCRPGRLGYHIALLSPARGDIEKLLVAQLARRVVLDAIPMDEATALLDGESQAAIVQALDDGAMLAVGAGEPGMTWPHLRTALLRHGKIVEPAAMTPEVRWAVAVHEASHAIVGVRLMDMPTAVISMTIDPSHFGGRTRWGMDTMDSQNITGDHQITRAIVALAGMSGEREILGATTMGCGVDVDNATDTVMTIIRFGLAEEWGVLGLDKLSDGDRGMRLRDEYNALTRTRLAEYQRRADALIRGNTREVVALAKRLDAAGHLAGDELQSALRESLDVAA